jgi:hypothetical protein
MAQSEITPSPGKKWEEKNRKRKRKRKEKNTHLHNLAPPALLVLHEVDGLDDVDVVEGGAVCVG